MTRRINLPKPIEKYFAFEELDSTGDFRNFQLVFFYNDGGRTETLIEQWHISGTAEALHRKTSEDVVEVYRSDHAAQLGWRINRLLEKEGKVLGGDAPIPDLRDEP